ncbi:helix-turn-helix transcriptional regulator [Ideonella sp. DXS29W]|uniref:Helix-turn-helix transcriptional regulator n=1 Tax=Ideonella lacteola TaxID=2984193 RepID=A0ABU9BV14_9BURK
MLSTLSTSPDAPDVGDAFLRAAEAAHQVGSPQQFFVWLRLHVYRFLPHDLALLRTDTGRQGGRQTHVLNCVPLPKTLEGELSDTGLRLWSAWSDAWVSGGERALAIDLRAPAWSTHPTAVGLVDSGFAHVLVHALRGLGGQGEEVQVAFLRQGDAESPSEAARCALDLWMPYLRFALSRVYAANGAMAETRPRGRADGSGGRPLTDREIQVLAAVREAKANAQIAVMLGISPLTVKNHLRSIQKKLGARNRAHAVAEAMSMRLIS